MLTIAEARDAFFHSRTIAYLDDTEKRSFLIEVLITEVKPVQFYLVEGMAIHEVELTLVPKKRAEWGYSITSFEHRFSSLYAMQGIQTDV